MNTNGYYDIFTLIDHMPILQTYVFLGLRQNHNIYAISNKSGLFPAGSSIEISLLYLNVTVLCILGTLRLPNIMILDVFDLFCENRSKRQNCGQHDLVIPKCPVLS